MSTARSQAGNKAKKRRLPEREASFFAHFSKLNLGLAVVLAGDVASHRVHDDGRPEHDEQHRDDELQVRWR